METPTPSPRTSLRRWFTGWRAAVLGLALLVVAGGVVAAVQSAASADEREYDEQYGAEVVRLIETTPPKDAAALHDIQDQAHRNVQLRRNK